MQQLAALPGGLSVCQDWYFGPDGNAVGGDPGPGKPPNEFPLQQSAPPTPWTPPPYCPPWATIFSGPAECGGLQQTVLVHTGTPIGDVVKVLRFRARVTGLVKSRSMLR
jgi:hypothetical protein